MKKILIVAISLIFAMQGVFAQEAPVKEKKSREGKDFSEILPQAGDVSIGIDLANMVKVIGNNFVGQTKDNMVCGAFQTDFFVKYYLNTNNALRARLNIGVDNSTNREFVRDDVAYLLNPLNANLLTEDLRTVDTWENRNTNFELGIGYEYRRTLWRVQGYVGAELFGGMIRHRDIYSYGNVMTATNQTPTSTDWNPVVPPISNPWNGTRPLESVGGNTIILGASAFIGADIFLTRNISMGAEFALQARYNYTTEMYFMTETWKLEQAYIAKELAKPVQTSFNLRPTGYIHFTIHF